MLKGNLLSALPNLNIVDINHVINAFHIAEAAFVLNQSFGHFPTGSIHMICVDEYNDHGIPGICMFLSGHWFIGPNNSIFPLIRPAEARTYYSLDYGPKIRRFPALEIYVPAAIHIAKGLPIEAIGKVIHHVEFTTDPNEIKVKPDKSGIEGKCIYIDNYGNVITNIKGSYLKQIMGDRKKINIKIPGQPPIEKLSDHYRNKKAGDLLAFINSQDLIEIAICGSSESHKNGASQLLGISLHETPLYINFS